MMNNQHDRIVAHERRTVTITVERIPTVTGTDHLSRQVVEPDELVDLEADGWRITWMWADTGTGRILTFDECELLGLDGTLRS